MLSRHFYNFFKGMTSLGQALISVKLSGFSVHSRTLLFASINKMQTMKIADVIL